MPVDEPVDLRKPLSSEDIDKLNREADEAKEAVDRYEEADKRIEGIEKDAKKSAKGAEDAEQKAAQALLRAENREHGGFASPLSGMGSASFEGDASMGGQPRSYPGMPSGVGRGSGSSTGNSPLGEMIKNRQSFKDKMKSLEEKVKKNAERMSKVEKGVQQGMQAISNPAGFGMSKLSGKLGGIVGKLGIAGGLAMVAITIAEFLWKEFKNSFKPGGVNDIRKMMADRDKEMAELNDILDRRAGRVFFSTNTTLRQGAPQHSNTERMRDQVWRYQALHVNE